MKEMIIVAATALTVSWLLLYRMSRVVGRPLDDLFHDLFRFDLDRLPVKSKWINSRYTALMRKTGVVGPYGITQARKHIVIQTPMEDYRYIKSFGLPAFEAQLLAYVQGYSVEQGWSTSESSDAASIQFEPDNRRKRLRPRIAPAGSAEKETAVLEPDGANLPRPPVPERVPQRGQAQTFGPEKTSALPPEGTQAFDPAHGACLEYEDSITTLPVHGGEITVGSSDESDVVVRQVHYSGQQMVLWCVDNRWFIKSVGRKNATHLNGVRLTGTAILQDGDAVLVGASSPLVFRNSSR